MPELKKEWPIHEIVTLVVLSVTLGVLWCGLSCLTPILKPLRAFGLGDLLSGFWFMGGTLIPFFIRRPGAALMGELLAAGIEAFQWGFDILAWGFIQGLGSELIFLVFRYKRYDLFVLIQAGMLSGLFAWVFNFFYYQYGTLAPWIWFLQIGSILLSGAVLAGWLSYYLGTELLKTGVASHLSIEQH